MDMASYMRNRRAERRQFAYDYLGNMCAVCGTKDSLEFDHIDAKTKLMTITSAKSLDGSLDRMINELDKCQLLCVKHHKEKTKRCGDSKGGHNKVLVRRHGTQVKYADGCRCEECRTWKRLYRKKLIDHSGRPL